MFARLVVFYEQATFNLGKLAHLSGRHVIETGFSKRDIQRQLETFLQPRPNLTRSVPHIMKTRFHLMQECKTFRALDRQKRRAASKSEPDQLPIEETVTSTTTQSSMAEPHAMKASTPHPDQLSKTYPSPSTTVEILDSQNFEAGMASPELCFEDALFSLETGLATPEDFCAFLVNSSPGVKSDLGGQHIVAYAGTEDRKSLLSTDTGQMSKLSGISLRSLRKRLPSKNSTSLLKNVKSFLERLTISEGSTASINQPEATAMRDVTSASVPIRSNHAVTLPGFFHQYCWEHINHSALQRCDDRKSPCTLGPIFQPTGKETHRTIRSDVLFRIRATAVGKDDLDQFDVFGNSVLHIAASLGASPSYLDHLVKQGANITSLNHAHQTFLHLINLSDVTQMVYFRFLLNTLTRRNFNFQQQDDNGQTTIHALTVPSVAENILTGIVQSLQFCGIHIPTCRDNLGFTVANQLRGEARSQVLRDDNTKPRKLEDNRAIATQTRPPREGQMDDDAFNKLEKHSSIETVEDLQEYELHADLLRTIVRSRGGEPAFEDMDGRNGLHCLAQVSFDLPCSTSEPHKPSATSPSSLKREKYLDDLLVAGVDPNSHDKHGDTPLLSFIAAHRAYENDSSITRLLQRLFEAGATLNRRNRGGETALHLAVSLGNRAATKFLLSHGANIHARTGDGRGVVAHALRASNKTQEDEKLYAQILLCVALVEDAGAVSAPTILHEWASPEFRIRPG